MLKDVEEVCIIDSFVVDKANFLATLTRSAKNRASCLLERILETEGNNPKLFMKLK